MFKVGIVYFQSTLRDIANKNGLSLVRHNLVGYEKEYLTIIVLKDPDPLGAGKYATFYLKEIVDKGNYNLYVCAYNEI